MSKVDIIIILLYFIILLAIGFFANHRQKDMEDYYVAGRNRGTLSIMCLWLCGWVGGSSIIGTSQLSHDIGLGGGVVSFSVVLGLLIFAFTASGRINRIGAKYRHLTYPDLIEARYGRGSAVIATITTVLSYIAFIASQFVAGGNILASLTGWGLGRSYLICAAVIVLYTTLGGYLAVTFTDWLQFSLIILGVVLITFPLVLKTVPPRQLVDALPASVWDVSQYGSPATILGMLVATVFSFYTAMDSYTRMYAAKSPRAAKTGTLLCAGFVLAILVATVYIGMASRLIIPDMKDSAQAMSLVMTALLPSGLRGLLIIGILSAIMSTADISILTASSNLTNDIYHKYVRREAGDAHLLRVAMAASLGLGALGAALAWFKQDIIGIIYIAFTLSSANLFIPTVFGFFWKRGTAKASFYSMLLSLIVVLAWYLMPIFGVENRFLGTNPIWPGLAVSAAVYFLLSFWKEPEKEEQEKIQAFLSLDGDLKTEGRKEK